MKTIEAEGTIILDYLFKHDTSRFIALIGGAGSGKSYAVAQYLIYSAYTYPDIRVLVSRKTLPSLRITAFRLVRDLMDQYGLPYDLNKTELNITLPNKTEILFKSIDDPSKILSAEFNLIWAEEATEITGDDFQILNLRLRRGAEGFKNKIILTCNPISINSWVRSFSERPDVSVHHSTWRDNPYLPDEYVEQLLALKTTAPDYYNIYTEGLWGELKGLIYTNWDIVKEMPEGGLNVYGIDFGFNNPTAVVQVKIYDDEYYINELLYQSGLTNADLISKLGGLIEKNAVVYCDSAEPARIEEIKRAGYNSKPAIKEVMDGINLLKSKKLHITENSVNIIKEIQGYRWEEKDGQPIDRPLKFNDHAMDAIRYATSSAPHKRVLPDIDKISRMDRTFLFKI